MGAEHSSDGTGRDLAAKAEQFAVDPLVAPPRILPGESQDQLLHLVGNRWPSSRCRGIGPSAAHHAPVPVEEGLGLDQEHRPAGSRELAAQRCQQGAILGLQPGPWMLATQDREFVAQDQDLDFLGLSRPAAEHDQLEDVAQRQVEERPDHRHPSRGRQGTTAHRSLSQGRASPLVTSTTDFWHPTRLGTRPRPPRTRRDRLRHRRCHPTQRARHHPARPTHPGG